MLYRRDRRRAGGRARIALLASAGFGLVACVPEAPGGSEDPVGPGTPGPEARYSVQLRWNPPEVDAEGEPLADLAGFRLYYAPDPRPVMEDGGAMDVGLAAEALVTGLSAGDWRFAVTAVDTAGNESDPSDVVRVEVGQR